MKKNHLVQVTGRISRYLGTVATKIFTENRARTTRTLVGVRTIGSQNSECGGYNVVGVMLWSRHSYRLFFLSVTISELSLQKIEVWEYDEIVATSYSEHWRIYFERCLSKLMENLFEIFILCCAALCALTTLLYRLCGWIFHIRCVAFKCAK